MKQAKAQSRSTSGKPGIEADKADVPLEKRIGDVVKHLRLSANLTLAELSAGAGVSSAMLSRVENGMATASLDTLERLCHALGVNLSDLFRQTEQKQGSAQLVKKGDQMEVVRVGTKHGHTYRLLSYDRGPRKIFEPFLIEMDRKSQSWPRFSHPGVEFIFMLQGRVEYRFGDKTYILEPGDAFTLSGDVVHGPERLLAFGQIAGPFRQEVEHVRHPREQGFRGEEFGPCGCQFDGEGQAVQPAAYFPDGLDTLRVSMEMGVHIFGPFEEEEHGGRLFLAMLDRLFSRNGQGGDRNHMLPPQMQGSAAGDQNT